MALLLKLYALTDLFIHCPCSVNLNKDWYTKGINSILDQEHGYSNLGNRKRCDWVFERAMKSELLAWIKGLWGEKGRENFRKLCFNRPKNKQERKSSYLHNQLDVMGWSWVFTLRDQKRAVPWGTCSAYRKSICTKKENSGWDRQQEVEL